MKRKTILAAVTLCAALLLTTCDENPLRAHIVKSTVLLETENVIYVSATTGNDLNLGTRAAPKETIQAGIDVFAEDGLTGVVLVAEGTYNVNFDAGTHVVMHEGVSVYGGHDPVSWNWKQISEEESQPYETIIQDTSSGENMDGTLRCAVYIGPGITPETEFVGFTVEGGTSQNARAFHIEESSPSISRCTIAGGAPDVAEGQWSYAVGVTAESSGVQLYKCDITGSTSEETWYSNGLVLTGASETSFSIHECTLDGGNGTLSSEALVVDEEARGWAGACTVTAQPSETSGAVNVSGDSQLTIQDSEITAGGGTTRSATGLYVDSSTVNAHHNTISCLGGSELAYAIEIKGSPDAWVSQSTITAMCAPDLAGLFIGTSDGTGTTGGASELVVTAGGEGEAEGGRWVRGVYISESNFNIGDSMITAGYGSETSFGIELTEGGHGEFEGNVVSAGTAPSTAGFSINDTANDWVNIRRSDIYAGMGDWTRGVRAVDANVDVTACIIHGGVGSEGVRGIDLLRSDSSITNNTIYSGTSTASSIAIALVDAQPGIRNNILFNGKAGASAIVSDPLLENYVENNLFYDYLPDMPAYYCVDEGPDEGEYLMNDPALDPYFQNNIDDPPFFGDIDGEDDDINTEADNDWHLSAATLPAVYEGALDFFGDEVPIDRDGVSRTLPYSIGAYEYDG